MYSDGSNIRIAVVITVALAGCRTYSDITSECALMCCFIRIKTFITVAVAGDENVQYFENETLCGFIITRTLKYGNCIL
jgi:hypothetical protein